MVCGIRRRPCQWHVASHRPTAFPPVTSSGRLKNILWVLLDWFVLGFMERAVGILQLLEQQVGEFAEPGCIPHLTHGAGRSGRNGQKTSPERNGVDRQGCRQFCVKFKRVRCLFYTKTIDKVFQPADCRCLQLARYSALIVLNSALFQINLDCFHPSQHYTTYSYWGTCLAP